ncbi:MAG TPA: cytochrome c biogenesis protein CcsA [Acidimicrobiales bacterium]|nr:cytochrome c biogenesis protein CcsA [Acidimicrobiales bacterium]
MKSLGERDELRSTSSRGTRILGGLSIVGVLFLGLAGLWWSPEDSDMGDLVRIMYVHVPSAWLAYMAFIITAIGSVMFLWKRSVWWDLIAGASAEIGVLFCALALATGSLWGRPTWGTYWLWSDVRIVTTLVLLLMYAGYLALRRVDGDPTQRSKRAAIVGLIAAANIPVVRYSVHWWSNRTLHQQDTVGLDTKLDNGPLFTLMLGLVVFTILFAWMLLHRFRIAWLESETEHRGLEQALIERRAEGRAKPERLLEREATPERLLERETKPERTLGAAEVRP